MAKVKQIKIVKAATHTALEKSVNIKLREGWKLRGNIFQREDDLFICLQKSKYQ